MPQGHVDAARPSDPSASSPNAAAALKATLEALGVEYLFGMESPPALHAELAAAGGGDPGDHHPGRTIRRVHGRRLREGEREAGGLRRVGCRGDEHGARDHRVLLVVHSRRAARRGGIGHDSATATTFRTSTADPSSLRSRSGCASWRCRPASPSSSPTGSGSRRPAAPGPCTSAALGTSSRPSPLTSRSSSWRRRCTRPPGSAPTHSSSRMPCAFSGRPNARSSSPAAAC